MANTNNNKSLNVPNLRFKEFSGEWKKVIVSDLLEFYSTNSLSWDQLDFDKGEILNLHYGLIHKGLPTMVDLKYDRLPFIKREIQPRTYTLCKNGDVAFADASEDTNDIAKAVELKNCDNKAIVCGLHTIHGRDKSNSTIVGYKGYAFASFAFHRQIRRLAQGTKIYSINIRNFSESYIGIPSKQEQEQISMLLLAIDRRIVTQSLIIEKLQSLIKGLKQKLLNDKYNTITKIKLNEICEIKSGYSGNQVLYETPYKVSRIETISKHNIDMGRIGFVENIDDIYKLNYGDILFSNINSVQYIGNTAFIDKDYNLYHGMNLLRLIPNKTIVIPRYLHLLLSTDLLINHFQTICNKAVSQASINQTELGKTILYLPSISRQKYLCNIFISCENKLNIEQMILAYLRVQKSFLLQQLFI